MGILLVYDVTDEGSFNNIKGWMRNIEQHASDNVNKVRARRRRRRRRVHQGDDVSRDPLWTVLLQPGGAPRQQKQQRRRRRHVWANWLREQRRAGGGPTPSGAL